MQIENPASGLAYLENRFETMDWEDFETNLTFELDGVSTVVEKNKVTNANDPNTWLLEYRSITEMISHKLEGLKKLGEKIEEEYNPLDLTETFTSFDKYSRLARALISRRVAVYKALDSDIRFLEKFNAAKDLLAEIKKNYTALKKQYDAVVAVEKIEEIPGVEAAIEKTQKAIVDALFKEGISAEELYAEAVEDFNSSNRSSAALAKFQQLNGYKDSSTYIAKINSLSVFGNVIEANGKQYYYITKESTPTFNVSNPAASESSSSSGCSKSGCGKSDSSPAPAEESYSGVATALYAIENKEYDPQKPIVKDITTFLTSYNSRLFFISRECAIKTFHFGTGNESILDSGKRNCYEPINPHDSSRMFVWSPDRTSIYFKKRLEAKPVELQNSGCFRKAPPPPEEQLNNFSVLKVNLIDGRAETVVSELVDIMDVYGDYIFFTQSRTLTENKLDKKGRPYTVKTPKTFFSSYNMVTGEMVDMLGENDCIINAVDGKVVYAKYSSSPRNQDLYVYDVAEKTSLLLEKNIYFAYHEIHDSKVLYAVGNTRRSSMFSINLDGSGRTEILLNVEKIAYFDKNWMYVIKGHGYNRSLIKISYDGKDRVFVAYGMKKLIKMTAGYVYYLDYSGYLCMVRNDGKMKRTIIDDCDDAKIIIDVDSIFIMRTDYSGISSLYQVDLEGHNLRKIYFGLEDMGEIDEKRIFFLQKETREYKVTTPQEKGEPIVSYIDRTIYTYYSFDKYSHEIKEFLVIGLPKEKTFEFKRGCFGRKTVTEHSTIEEVTKKIEYQRIGKAEAGEVTKEAEAAAAATNAPQSIAQSTGCNGSGCSGKK